MRIALILVISLTIGLQPLAALAQTPGLKPKLALLPFRVVRLAADLGPALDSHLAGSVDASGMYDVITPDDINAMLGLERMKDATGCTDTSCAAGIGGALGVEFLLAPEATALGDSVDVTLTLIDVRHASVLARKQGRAPKDERFLGRAVDDAVAALLGRVSPHGASGDVTLSFSTDADGEYKVTVEGEGEGGQNRQACENLLTLAHPCVLRTVARTLYVTATFTGDKPRAPVYRRIVANPGGYVVHLEGTSGSVTQMVLGGLGVGFGFFAVVGSTLGFVLDGTGTGLAMVGGGLGLAAVGGVALYYGFPHDRSTVEPSTVLAPPVALSARWWF